MLYRDDDISRDTDLGLFKSFHEVYKKHNDIHTIAVVARDLWKNRELTWYLETEPLLDIQYHGLDHINYQDEAISNYDGCVSQLKQGKEYLEEKLHRPIRVFYPPWNVEGQEIRHACAGVGLVFDNARIEARDYLNGGMGARVNLHYWQDQDIIEDILAKDKKSNARIEFHKNLNEFIKLFNSTGTLLHVGKTHVYDYRAYFPWAHFLELDNDKILKPDIIGSIEKTKIKRSFDGIICFGVFEYLSDRVSAVNEIHRLLKPSGYALIGIPMNINPQDAIDKIKELFTVVYENITEETDMETFANNSKYYWHCLVKK